MSRRAPAGRSIRWPIRRRRLSCARRTGLLLEPLNEPFEQPHPYFIPADDVLDAVFEVGIVVDLHDDEALVRLLHVDPVEAVADRPRRAHCNVDERGRSLVDVEGLEAAFARGAVGAVLDDLRMAARHTVLADEQRLAGKDAHAPVE